MKRKRVMAAMEGKADSEVNVNSATSFNTCNCGMKMFI